MEDNVQRWNPYLYIRKAYPNPFIKGLDIIIPQAGIYTSYVVRDLEKILFSLLNVYQTLEISEKFIVIIETQN